MIVATAGHINHGKTALVRALTGTDTDRLAEEKRRGMTIDLGFAYLPAQGGKPIAFVDVPGHERFIRNMIAGVQGIDAALLTVAADDGPMRQTLEHIRILELLDVKLGAIALTKIDRVPASRRTEAEHEVREAVAGTAIEEAPLFGVCAPSGEGIELMREWLRTTAQSLPARNSGGRFRMNVDRAFILEGRGLVATGTVISGSIRADDEITVLPHGLRATVRSLRANNEERDVAAAGERCALNLPGLGRETLARGCTIVSAGAYALSRRIDAEIRWEPARGTASKQPRNVQLCIGTGNLPAQVSRLGSSLARLAFLTDVTAFHGDRLLLRDPGSGGLLGAGRVLDPVPPERMRYNAARLATLQTLDSKAEPSRVLSALLDAEAGVVDIDWFARAWHLGETELHRARGDLPVVTISGGAPLALLAGTWAVLLDEVLAAIAGWHAEHPQWIGARLAQVLARCPRWKSPLVDAALDELIRRGRIARDGAYLRLPEHRPVLSAADDARWRGTMPLLAPVNGRPPRVLELAQRLKAEPADLAAFLERVAKTGRVYRVAGNRFALPETVADLEALAAQLCNEAGDDGFTAAAFRDRSGLGRNLTIELLELLDELGVTRRQGATRYMQARKRNGPRWDARTSNPSGGV